MECSFLDFRLLFVSISGVSLLDKCELNSGSFWEGDGWGGSITNDNAVANSGGVVVSIFVLEVGGVVGTWMLLNRLEDTNSTDVVTSGKHDSGTGGELNSGINFLGNKVQLDRIVQLDIWVSESDGSSIMSDDVRNLLLANEFFDDFAELELSLLGLYSMWLESTLDVEENSEMFISLFNSNNVHGTEWESVVSSKLSIDLNQTFFVLNDLSSFVSRESVLQSLLQENVKRNAFSCLVWSSGWLGGVDTVQFT